MLELRLSGTTVQMLADNAHLSGRNGPADASDIPGDHPDALLDRAATRWYRAAAPVRLGKGTQYRGPVSATEAECILDYIDSVAGAIEGVDPESNAEARAYRRSVATAVKGLESQGAKVRIDVGAYGIRTFYVTVPEGGRQS